MALVTGTALDPKRFFSCGDPPVQGSSFDLTIGHIFDHDGKKVDGLFTIKPGHMVQVVSSEVFCLNDRVTGHVTYKTTLTKKGIWALTVGIVDPGWDGPIATTLLNFSRVDHAIAEGDTFLRVTFFEHDPVPLERLRKAPPLEVYLKDIRKAAASSFPTTFLDTEQLAEAAGDKVLEQVHKKALVWVACIAVLFTVLQLVTNAITYRPDRAGVDAVRRDFDDLRERLNAVQSRLLKFEQVSTLGPAPVQATPPPSPPAKPPTSQGNP